MVLLPVPPPPPLLGVVPLPALRPPPLLGVALLPVPPPPALPNATRVVIFGWLVLTVIWGVLIFTLMVASRTFCCLPSLISTALSPAERVSCLTGPVDVAAVTPTESPTKEAAATNTNVPNRWHSPLFEISPWRRLSCWFMIDLVALLESLAENSQMK